MEPYLTQLHRGPLRTTLARFRLGQHWLQTRLGRFGPHRVPYESRWCRHCASVNQHKAVDSEEHALLKCPLYHDLRQQQPWAQQQPCSLQAFMALPPLQQASFLQACCDRHLGKVQTLCKGSDSGVGRICLLMVRQHMTLVSVRKVHVSALPGQLALHLCLLVQLASQEQSLLKV